MMDDDEGEFSSLQGNVGIRRMLSNNNVNPF